MGWGTSFYPNVYLNRMTFNDVTDVTEKIEENEKYISTLKSQLKMFASANVKDIIPEDWKEEPIRWIDNEIDSILEQLKEFENENVRLWQYHDYLTNNEYENIVIDWQDLKDFYYSLIGEKTESILDIENKEQMERLLKPFIKCKY